VAEVLVYEPPGPLPYEKTELAVARRLLERVDGTRVSQRELAEALEELSPPEARVEGASLFLDGGYFAVAGSFRSEDGATRSAILDTDLEPVSALLRARRPIDGHILPVPLRAATSPVDRPAGLAPSVVVVNGSSYDPRFGYFMPEKP
jgi:hypothetical protein